MKNRARSTQRVEAAPSLPERRQRQYRLMTLLAEEAASTLQARFRSEIADRNLRECHGLP
jgi:hypothetical protein